VKQKTGSRKDSIGKYSGTTNRDSLHKEYTVSENTNDKEKVNSGQVNFKWKEIEETPKKSRWSIFNFLKRKPANTAKKDKVVKPVKPAEPVKENKPAKPAEKPVKKDESVKSTKEEKTAKPVKKDEAVKPAPVAKVDKPAEPALAAKADKPVKEDKVAKSVKEEKTIEPVKEDKVNKPAQKGKKGKKSKKKKANKPVQKDEVTKSAQEDKAAEPVKEKPAEPAKEEIVAEPVQNGEVTEPTQEDKVDKTAQVPESDTAVEAAQDVEVEKAVESNQVAEAEKTEEPAQEAEADKPAQADEAEKTAEPAKEDKGDKAVQADEADKVAESGKTEKPVKPAKKKKARKRSKRRTLLTVLLGLLFVFVLAFVGLFIYAYNSVPDIDPDASSIYSNIDLSSIIYDSKGAEIDKLYYTEDREIVSIKDIPENTKNAFIAIEDKTFYKHHGLNYKRLFGAVLSKLTGRSEEISGTSTITQQLARNVFLSEIKSERTLSRKVREMIYALKIERVYSKDEILEAYLNTIYLGYGCYGIKAAAYTYFGKDVSDLKLAESAALAALPQAPDTYALLKDSKDENTTYMKKYGLYANELASDRRDLVLDLMAEQGYISTEKAEKAKKKLADVLHPHIEKKPKELTYFTDYLTTEVAQDLAEKYSMSMEKAELLIHTGGLRIYSTIDQDIQNAINTEFSDDWNFPYSEETPQAAMVVTEVGTGRIRAMVGGRNTSGQMLFNRATSPRQPGSSIKPLAVYSAALQKSEDFARRAMPFPFVDYGFDRQGVRWWGDYITAGSTVIDERMFINNEVWPLNFSRRFSGYRTFRTALQQSINTCAVKIQLQVGPEYSMEMLRKYGISTIADDASEPTNDYNPAALALGAMTYGTTPLDMALAYATFPNKGVRNEGSAYTKVTDDKGKVVLEKEPEGTQVLAENVAFIMRDCLESVVSRGIARSASIYGVQVGGKTGTTNDNYDYWFVGFTPKYSAALWIGTDHNTVMSGSSGNAAYLWSKIMSQVPDITAGEYPPQPEDVVMVRGEYYTEATQP